MNFADWKRIELPLSESIIADLRPGDRVLLSGRLFTARDRAHERLVDLFLKGDALPFDPRGEILYYVGPSPTPPGRIIGSAGPTTSYRMDPFTEPILKMGIRGMIGKGRRGAETRRLLVQYRAIYFSSFGGAAAFLAERIKSCRVLAFDDLGPEAIHVLDVEDFPAVVVNDVNGGDLYEDAIRER